MKKTRLFFLLLFVLSAMVSAQTGKEAQKQQKADKYAELKALIESGKYQFEADRALPVRGSSVDLTTHNAFLEVSDSVAIAHLPFFGRAYHVPYGGNGGISFEGETEEYRVEEHTRKGQLTVSFTVDTNTDLFVCYLTASSSQSATLMVSSQQRESITYYGSIEAVREAN